MEVICTIEDREAQNFLYSLGVKDRDYVHTIDISINPQTGLVRTRVNGHCWSTGYGNLAKGREVQEDDRA